MKYKVGDVVICATNDYSGNVYDTFAVRIINFNKKIYDVEFYFLSNEERANKTFLSEIQLERFRYNYNIANSPLMKALS